MEKKIRIQLFTLEGNMVDDRLVGQTSEFASGPKIAHNGPIRIEFTLFEKGDVESAKEYLDKLTGTLPLSAKESKKFKKKNVELADDDREGLINFLVELYDGKGGQEDLIKTLREHEFVFCTDEFIKSLNTPLVISQVHQGKYQWMIRRTKTAKDPSNDKYDPMLAFGINIIEPKEKVVIYLNGALYSSMRVKIPSNPREVYKKSGLIKYPHYMIQEERDRFGVELRQLEKDPTREQSKFFMRWKPFVENLPEAFADKQESKG